MMVTAIKPTPTNRANVNMLDLNGIIDISSNMEAGNEDLSDVTGTHKNKLSRK